MKEKGRKIGGKDEWKECRKERNGRNRDKGRRKERKGGGK